MAMMKCTCMYCDYKWEKNIYTTQYANSLICPRCKDSFVKVRDVDDDKKADYYKGCPDFLEEKLEDEARDKDEDDDFVTWGPTD